jgi:hypothetical protein
VVESSCIMFYSTASLALANNRLTGTIPSEIGTMTALSKSSCCFVPCRDDYDVILMCRASFYRLLVSPQQ